MIEGRGLHRCCVADFAAGAVEQLSSTPRASTSASIEAPGSLGHPGFSGVTSRAARYVSDALVLVHQPGAHAVQGAPARERRARAPIWAHEQTAAPASCPRGGRRALTRSPGYTPDARGCRGRPARARSFRRASGRPESATVRTAACAHLACWADHLLSRISRSKHGPGVPGRRLGDEEYLSTGSDRHCLGDELIDESRRSGHRAAGRATHLSEV
jgi:hypothetical protein